ncbi:DcaP family trimeric outer membrane transporter [Ferrimonas balearica]|uniref:DcaP family trimeric outer membrane transporter n=1 Tax=Ferrimonas balearica TaxID=44012 RepID=UPI001C55BE13|nr:porin [Ferrimonas balearica]MBW3163024.1 porin [Ferrimonas balearica]MBY6106455.1 porin [Ferrimonas balearica]MBY6222968.1 porin [Ferrimonas balearica]
MNTFKLPKTALAPVAIALLAASPLAQADTEFKFGGYVKADVMVSDYSNGAPGDSNLSRQFYVPGTIYGDDSRASTVTDFQARETRFNFTSNSDLDGHTLKFFLELDFFTHSDGNQRVSNSYSPRLRHATVTFDNWTAGQTWSTFQNPGALPEALDFVGAAEGTPFVRQGLIRYTAGGFQVALENPKATFTNAEGGRVESDSSYIPDFVARYNFKGGDASFSIAGLVRQLEIDENGFDESETGYGVSFAGVVPVFNRDMLKFMLNYGDGAGRYLALNYANGAALTDAGTETISSVSGFVSYQHWWSDRWRSNITASAFEADNPDVLANSNANETSYSGNINLLYSPVKPVTIGVEYLYALNEQADGDDGELNRFMLSFKYAL